MTRHRLVVLVGAAVLSGRIALAGQGDVAVALSAQHLDRLRQIAMSADLSATPLTAVNAKILGLPDAIQAKQLMG